MISAAQQQQQQQQHGAAHHHNSPSSSLPPRDHHHHHDDDEDVVDVGGEDSLNLKGTTDQDMEDEDDEGKDADEEEDEDLVDKSENLAMKRRTMGTTGEEEDAHHSNGVSPMKKKIKLEVPPGPVVATVSESSADTIIKSEDVVSSHHAGSVLPPPTSSSAAAAAGLVKSGPPAPSPQAGGSPNRTASPLLRPSPPSSNLHSSNANGLIRVPHDHDVLCGRGGDINSHPGNRKFRAWVSERREAYNLAQSRSEKAKIPREIVDLVRSQSPPGRFLIREDKVNHRTASTSSNNSGDDDGAGAGSPPATSNSKAEGTGSWIQIDDARAVAKTSQALREGAPVIRATLERARTAPSLQGRGVSLEGGSGGGPAAGTPPGAAPYPTDMGGGGGGMRGDARNHPFRSPSDPQFMPSGSAGGASGGSRGGGGGVGMLGYHPDHAAAAAAVGMAAAAAAGPPPPYGKLRRNTSHPAHPWDAQRSGYTEAVESGFLRPMRMSHAPGGKDNNKPLAPQNKPQSAAAIREKEETVAQWLMHAVPSLHRDDIESYSQRLVRDGFDSIVMLDNELLEEDLDFMKKAHRRALLRNKAARSSSSSGGGVPPPPSGTPPPPASSSTSSTP